MGRNMSFCFFSGKKKQGVMEYHGIISDIKGLYIAIFLHMYKNEFIMLCIISQSLFFSDVFEIEDLLTEFHHQHE